MEDLGLDRPAAMLMYRAERLQEKGQLQQALRYFDRVLSSTPDCEEAQVNARMIREQLSEQAPPQLPTVSEHLPATQPAAPPSLQTAELQVTDTFYDRAQWDCFWSEAEMNDAVLEKARGMLEEHGISSPFLTLVKNDIETYTPPVHEDPWMDNTYTCRAIVRVTFPPPGAVSPTTPAAGLAGGSLGESRVREAALARLLSGFMNPDLPTQLGENAEQSGSVKPEPDAERSASGSSLKRGQAASSSQPARSSMSMVDRLGAGGSGLVESSPVGVQSCAAAAAAAAPAASVDSQSVASSRSYRSSRSVRSS